MPARNEAARIAATIAGLAGLVDEVVVIDDASDDDTARIAAGAGAVVVRSPERLGYIGAIRRGFAAASGAVVVTVDADGEMPVERIPDLVAPILAGEAGMVQGHRDRVPRLSERLLSRLARIGGPVGDSGSGFRALRTADARRLVVEGSCICGSLALGALANGVRIEEIAITTRPVPGRVRRIAWGHARQAIVVMRLVIRARRAARRAGRP
jgi:glycosyltransferase involved in cell wall biosynthesis